MLASIVASIIAAAIVGTIVWLARRARKRLVPPPLDKAEFLIEMKMGPSSSSGGAGNNIKLKWDYLISMYNKTKHDALNVSVSFDLGKLVYRLKKQPQRHICGLETQQLTIEVEQEHKREVVLACADRFRDLLPMELRHLKMLLSYEDEGGRHFACTATNNDGAVEVTYVAKEQ